MQPTPPLLHPSGRSYRYTVLALASLMLFGSYFAYDSVGAIENTLMEVFHTDRSSIGAMYSMYSVAAFFSVLLGGFLIDRIGTRRASMLFSALVLGGASVVAFAPNLPSLYVGRIVFGIGSESLVVAQSAILARWFTGKELALSFGVSLTVSRLGTLFSFNTMALLAARLGYRGALWIAAALCAFGLLSNWLYTILDHRAQPVLGLHEAGAGDKIVLSDARKFPASYWFVTMLCVTFYSAIFPFTALATDFFHDKWGLPQASGEGMGFLAGVFYNLTHMFTTAQGTTSIIITASMFCAPFAGNLVDRIGRRASLMILGSLLMIPAHLVLGLTTLPPALPMIVLGAAFVLVPAALWPSVPLIVDEKRVGTAFGLMTAIQNAGLLLFPFLNGQLRDATHGYTASQVMFGSLGAVGLVFSVFLWRADRREGGRLERGRASNAS
jgi:MFS family permease